MNYNMTNFTSSNTILDYAVASNDLSSGIFFIVILCFVFVIAFVNMKNYNSKDAFLASGFITVLLATVLFTVGLISSKVLLVFFVIFLISLGLSFFT